MGQKGTSDWAITQYVKDTFEENTKLIRDRRFLTVALGVSIVTNVVFALKHFFG
jgi:hypothetical protein